MIAADAKVDVGRHVHQVAGDRNQRAEPIRGGLRQLGREFFHHVDVQVQGAGMIRIRCHDRIQGRHDGIGVFAR